MFMAKVVGRADARLTERDERNLQRIVAQYGVNRAMAVRLALAWLAEEEPPRSRVEVDALRDLTASNRVLTGAVNRVGANLNQVVRRMHCEGFDESELMAAIIATKEVMDEVNERVRHEG